VPDAMDRAKQHQGVPVVMPRRLLDVPFQSLQYVVIGIDHGKIDLDKLSYLQIGKVLISVLPVTLAGKFDADLRQVVLDRSVVYMGQECSSLLHQVIPAPRRSRVARIFGG